MSVRNLRTMTSSQDLKMHKNGSMMGFDKRNPNQKPLSSLSTSPKAGTVSKPYVVTQKPGASPVVLAALTAKMDSSPNLKELGGVTWTDGTKGSSSLMSDNNNEYVDKFLGIPPPISHHPSDDEISLLSSQRNLFGGVPSRLPLTTDNNTANDMAASSSQMITDDVHSLTDSPRDTSNKEDYSAGMDPASAVVDADGMNDDTLNPHNPEAEAVDTEEGVTGEQEGESVADLVLLGNNVSAKEIPWPEQRSGDPVAADAGNASAAAASSSSSAKHVTIVEEAAGAVEGGESGVGAPASLFSAYSQSVGGAQWSNPNLLQRGLSSTSYASAGSMVEGGSQPSMLDMTTEVLRLQFALTVGQRKGRPLRHVAGSQFRNHVTATLQCDHCVTSDSNLRICKDNLRSTKLLLTRAHEEVSSLRRAKNLDAATNLIAVRDELLENQVVLIKRCHVLEEELAQAKKKTNTDTGVIEYLRKQVSELQEERRAKNEDAWKDREIERLKGLLEEMRRQIQGLQDEKQELLAVVETLKEGITAYKSQMASTESKRKVTERRSLTDFIHNAKTGHADEVGILRDQLFAKTEECTTLVLKVSKLGGEMSALGSVVKELQASNRTLGEQKNEMQQKARHATKDAEYARKKADDAEHLMNEMSERYRELEALGGSLAEDKRLLEIDLATMREEVRRLRESNTDLLNRLAQESETVRQTLEAAISSSVRLCVVAPTVNVHVSNSDTFKMQSGLPENSIRTFIMKEVLSKYTFLFKQEGENGGPQDGSPESNDLQEWIQRMLYLMQESIEQHIEGAMNES